MTPEEARTLRKGIEIYDLDTGEVYQVESVYDFARSAFIYIGGRNCLDQYRIFTNKQIRRVKE